MDLPSETVDRLVEAAEHVRRNAYAPYSAYPVGAAVMTSDGHVFVGVNVENASFGLSICAERHAVGAAVASGRRQFLALAIVTSSSPPATPCGACRQVLAEFGDFPIILAGAGGERLWTSVAELLPLAFTSDAWGAQGAPGT